MYAHTSKNHQKRHQIVKISISLQKIDVTENDGDDRFRTGNRNNAVSVHAQKSPKTPTNNVISTLM